MQKIGKASGPQVGARRWIRWAPGRCWRKIGVSLCLLLLCAQSALSPATHAQLNTILVAVDRNYPPFTFIDETGKLAGFEIDLVNELARINGWQVLFEPISFANLIPGVSTRLYDASISCIFVTEARKKLVNFTDPYYSSGMWLITLKGSNIRGIADLTPATRVGTVPGTVWETYTREHIQSQVLYSENAVAMFDSLVSGTISAAVNEREVLLGYLAKHPNAPLQTVGPALTYDECAIAVNSGQPRFLAALNEALTQVKADGRFDRIYRQWFGDLEPMVKPASTATDNPSQGTPTQPLITTTVTTTALSATTLPATTPVVGESAALAGVYFLTFQTTPPTYEIVTLTSDQLWLGAQSVQAGPPSPGLTPLPTYQGVWTVDANQQIRATTLNFQTDAQPTTLARRDYRMTVDGAGQIQGNYTLHQYPLATTPTLATTPLSATVTITFSGERLSVTTNR